MQGYVLNIVKVKDEDLIVSLLTQNNLKTLYRFYGARHSQINLGFKIDFEIQGSIKSSISQLRNITHLGNSWLSSPVRFLAWQQFIKLFYQHLKGIEEVGEIYFNIIEECEKIWGIQNPKRAAIEGYLKLLEAEGRLHSEKICYLCDEKTQDNISLLRSYIPSHPQCAKKGEFCGIKIEKFFETKKTIHLEDDEIDGLWNILLEGF